MSTDILINIKDWEEDGFRTPLSPYVTWLHDGTRNLRESVGTVRKYLALDERGGIIHDGIGLYLKNPDILGHNYLGLEKQFLDFPGSQVGTGYAPCLRLWHNLPRFDRHVVYRNHSGFASVVAGREIIT